MAKLLQLTEDTYINPLSATKIVGDFASVDIYLCDGKPVSISTTSVSEGYQTSEQALKTVVGIIENFKPDQPNQKSASNQDLKNLGLVRLE